MTAVEWENRVKSELPDFVTSVDQAIDADVALWIHKDDLKPENDDHAALLLHALLFVVSRNVPIGIWSSFKETSGSKWIATKENGKLFKLARILDIVHSAAYRCNKSEENVIVQS